MAAYYPQAINASATGGNIWPTWCDMTPSSSVTSVTNIIWDAWVTSSSTYTTTSVATAIGNTGEIWSLWIDQYGNIVSAQPAQAIAPQPTEEQLRIAAEAEARYREAEAQRREVAAEAEKQRIAAQKKAMELLRENLTKKQREQLDQRKWFLVEGGKSKKTYKIHTDRCAGNIYELRGDKEVARYCVHASYEIPLGDQLLAQAISLRLDEEYIISRANKTVMAA